MKHGRPSPASSSSAANSASMISARGSSRRATSASCGPEKAVFMNSALAPSLFVATYASTQPRWLRHMIATPSPGRTPSAASAWASAFERSCTARKVSVPASSISAGSSG